MTAPHATPARLSTCGICGGVIERRPNAVAGWGHVNETSRNADGHQPDPDDSHVSVERPECPFDNPDCENYDCDECENERALQDDADAHFDRVNNR